MLPLLSVAIALPLSANASVDINKTYVSLGSGHINCHRNINGRRVLGPFLPSTVLCSGLRHGGMREPIHLDDKQRNLNNLSTVSPTSKIATINNEARTAKQKNYEFYKYNKRILLQIVYFVRHPDNITKGRILLTVVAYMYGTLKVTLRQLYALPEPPSASAVSFIRGWLTVAAFYIIQLLRNRNKELNQHFIPTSLQNKVESIVEKAQNRTNTSKAETLPHFWISVTELSIWNFASTSLANIGLLSTESARASFLIQTSVLFTPLISVITGQMVSKMMWLGCGIVLSGLLLLSASNASSSTAPMVFIQSGDMFLLGGAFCWSMYLFRMSKIGKMKSKGSMLLTWKTIFVALLYSCWLFSSVVARRYEVSTWREALYALWAGYRDWKAWALLALSAIFPGAIADLLQQQGQKEVSATEANVLLSSEPIFTAMLSYLILGESTTIRENVGGALIVLGAIVASKHKNIKK